MKVITYKLTVVYECEDCDGEGFVVCSAKECPERTHTCIYCSGTGERETTTDIELEEPKHHQREWSDFTDEGKWHTVKLWRETI